MVYKLKVTQNGKEKIVLTSDSIEKVFNKLAIMFGTEEVAKIVEIEKNLNIRIYIKRVKEI